MKITVEIDDILDDCVNRAINQVKDELIAYLDDNELTECDFYDINDDGIVHEIIDGCVPIYTKQIKDTWYLHGDKLEEAYDNAALGENPMENGGMAAIYCYIEQEVHKWFDDSSEDFFQEYQEKRNVA
jgi:hypothetical protein